MDNLKEFQERMPHGFSSIAVDIVDYCNANCKYCPAGRDDRGRVNSYSSKHGLYIKLGLFDNILQKLIHYKLYSQSTNFHIYCLGEPCLHPQINDILMLLKKYSIRTNISTNASIIPQFTKESLESVNRFLISMPGFSQDSYDKIHGFNFEKIVSNIVKLRKQVDELSDGKIPFDMSYHIYQFNESEMVPAKAFCDRYGIRFAPNYAVMMDKDKCLDYVAGDMSYEDLKDISKEIFLGVLDQQIKDAPRNYCDIQNSFLSINASGDVRICSSFRKAEEPNILIGNIVTDNIDDIIWRKYHHPKCEQCIKAGLTPTKGYECKVYPDGYYSIMKENEFLIEYQSDPQMAQKLELMKLMRSFESKGDSPEIKEQVVCYTRENSLETDAKKIALKYLRFGEKTYSKLFN